MRIRLSGSKSTACMLQSRLGECEAAPLLAVPGAVGKSPTLVGSAPRHARCGLGHPAARASLACGGAGLGECEAAPLRAVPGAAGKGPTPVGTYLAARAPLACGGAELGGCKAAPLRAVPGAVGKGPTLEGTGPERAGCGSGYLAARALLACAGAGLESAKQLPSGLCPEQRARVPRTHACGGWPVACWMRIRLSCSKSAARLLQSGLGECELEAAPLRAVSGAEGKGPTLVGIGPWHA